MTWRVWVLVALVAAPAVAGQVVTAELEIRQPLESTSSLFRFDGCRAGETSDVVETPRGFHLVDTNTESACGEAVATVPVPLGAQTAQVRYNGTRVVVAFGGLLADQGVLDQFEPEVRATFGQKLGEAGDPIFEDGQVSTQGDHTVALGDSKPLQLVWHLEEVPFDDLGFPIDRPGAVVTLRIEDPHVTFRGVDVLGGVETVDEGQGRDHVERRLSADATVPPAPSDRDLVFRISNAWSIHHVRLPDGGRLPLDSFDSREEQGTLYLTVPADALEAYGPGTYTAVFATTAPLEATSGLIPVLLILALIPLAAGSVATRGAVRFRQRATAGYEKTARNLFHAIMLVWAGYALTGGYVLFGRLWPMVVAWPLQLSAAMVYGGFVITAIAFVVLDVSWRRQLDVSMQESLLSKERVNQDLKRSNEELEQFAYVASHDLQEPLRTVARFTQLLQRRYGAQLDQDAREFMDYSVQGAQRMQRLLEDLLAYSRIDRRGTVFTAADLDDTLRQVKASLFDRIQATGAQIFHDPLPKVLGDPRQLEQLFQNLLSNAIKFCAPGVTPEIHISAAREGSVWAIRVKDNGIGIPAEHHERIFTVFERLHGRDDYEGTGIGLAICKKIVERHGGAIMVASDASGTTFTFTLTPA